MKIVKITNILYFSFLLSPYLYGQETNIFNKLDFGILTNKSINLDSNSENKYGAGLGIYFCNENSFRIKSSYGIEINSYRFLINRLYESHFAHSTDIKYNITNLTISFNLRYYLPNFNRLYIEFGPYSDLYIHANREGLLHSYIPDDNFNTEYLEIPFKEKVSVNNIVGLELGLTYLFSFERINLFLKPIYKHGFNNYKEYLDYRLLSNYIVLSVGVNFREW